MTFQISTLWKNKPTRVALEWVAGVVALCCLLVVLLIVRLASGPMALDDLTPLLTAALSDDKRGLTTTISATKLLWNDQKGEIVLSLEGVVTKNAAGAVVATLPRADARLKALPLLIGRLSFKQLHAEGANLNLERNTDGQLIFMGTTPLGKVKTTDDWPLSALMAGWPERVEAIQDRINRLGEVTIRATQVTIYDRIDDFEIQGFVPELTIGATSDDEVIGKGMLRVTTKDQPIGIMLDMRLLPGEGTGETILSFRDVNPASIGKLDNDLAGLTAIDMPISGSINVTYMPDGLMQLTIKADAPKGTLTTAALPQPLAVQDFNLDISAVSTGSAGMTNATINAFGLKAGDSALSVTGKLGTRDDPGFRVLQLEPKLVNVKLDDLINLWPKDVAEGGRQWVTGNMEKGTVHEVTAKVSAAIGWPDIDVVEVDKVEGQFSLTGATVHYFRPMPPAVAVDAAGTFDKDTIYIRPSTGKLLNLTLGESTLDIKNLNDSVQTMDIVIPAKGSISDVLAAVDSKPLHYAEAVGIKPADMKGEVDLTLRLTALPLLNALKLDDITMQAEGSIKGFANSTLVPAFPLTNGTLNVKLDTKTMLVAGDVLAKGAKVNVEWQEVFSPVRGRPSSEAKITGAFTADDFKKLDFELPGAMQGAAPVTLVYKRHTTQPDVLQAAVDLTPVALDMSRLTYKKPAKKKAVLNALALLDESGITLEEITATADGVKLSGSGSLAKDGALRSLDFDDVQLGENKVSVNVSRAKNGGLRYVVKGAQMNVGAWLDASNDSNQQVSQSPFEVDLQLQRAIFGTDTSTTPPPANALKFFAPFSMDAIYNGKGWDKIVLTGKAGGTEDFNLQLLPGAKGQTLAARADNFGAVLDALNWTDDVIRGKLEIDGASEGIGQPLVATITVSDYKVLDLPFMARLINTLSLDGLAQLLSNKQGLEFEKLKGTIVLEGDVLRFKKLRTSGGSLGLTAAGTIDTASKNIDLEGTVVPFTGVNTVIGSIPIIGDILTGGNGGGVFAATYYAKGKLNDPQFSTNPLSALAPGIVRNIFFLDDH